MYPGLFIKMEKVRCCKWNNFTFGAYW